MFAALSGISTLGSLFAFLGCCGNGFFSIDNFDSLPEM